MTTTLSSCAGRTRTYIVLGQNQVGCHLPPPRIGALQAGLEPTTSELTAQHSAIELLESGRRGTRNPWEVVYSHAHTLNYDHVSYAVDVRFELTVPEGTLP